MKTVCMCLLVAVAMSAAEPQRGRFRPAWAAPQRQAAEEAPYPASGWRPSKEFNLPGEYGAPATEAPEESTTTEAAPETTTTPDEEATTTEAPGEESRGDDDYDAEPEPAPANIPTPGVYYVLLPDGTIQRVAYQAVIPAPSGRYIVEQVESGQAPVYAYSAPRLIRILRK